MGFLVVTYRVPVCQSMWYPIYTVQGYYTTSSLFHGVFCRKVMILVADRSLSVYFYSVPPPCSSFNPGLQCPGGCATIAASF